MSKHCIYLLFFLISLLANSNFLKAKGFIWSIIAGGVNMDAGNSIATDDSGNCYITGYFLETATFGNISLTSDGGQDIFIAKYDSTGFCLWAKKAGGFDNDEGMDIALDHEGNCYITGYFEGTASFGDTDIISYGYYDAFIAKYGENGQFFWVNSGGSATQDDMGISISTDENGNAFVTGYFEDTAMFDSTILNPLGFTDIFIAKYNPNSLLSWIKKAGGNDNDIGYSITVDSSGNCYITGIFSDTALFDTKSVISGGGYDCFITKYSAAGSIQWIKQSNSNNNTIGTSIALNDLNNLFISGYFEDTSIFGSNSVISNGLEDVFTVNYNTSGDLNWIKQGGGIGSDFGYNIDADNFGNAIITGAFSNSISFGIDSLKTTGQNEVFIVKYDSTGSLVWQKQSFTKKNATSYHIDINNKGILFITGVFDSTTVFGNDTIHTSGFNDIFISKFQDDYPDGFDLNKQHISEITLFPNPNNGRCTLHINNSSVANINITITNILGSVVYNAAYNKTFGEQNIQINLSGYPKGIYFLFLSTKNSIYTLKSVNP